MNHEIPCPECSASIPGTIRRCPFCLSPVGKEPAVRSHHASSAVEAGPIRKARNRFLWLMLVCLGIGAANIALAFKGLEIARQEKPEAVFRDIRFNRIEIQSAEYQTIQTILTVSQMVGKLLGGITLIFCFRFLRAMNYSPLSLTMIILALLLPLINLVLLIYLIQQGDKMAREEERTLEFQSLRGQ